MFRIQIVRSLFFIFFPLQFIKKYTDMLLHTPTYQTADPHPLWIPLITVLLLLTVVPQNLPSHILQGFDKYHLNLKVAQSNHPPKPVKIRVLVPSVNLKFSMVQSSPIGLHISSRIYMPSLKTHSAKFYNQKLQGLHSAKVSYTVKIRVCGLIKKIKFSKVQSSLICLQIWSSILISSFKTFSSKLHSQNPKLHYSQLQGQNGHLTVKSSNFWSTYHFEATNII